MNGSISFNTVVCRITVPTMARCSLRHALADEYKLDAAFFVLNNVVRSTL